MRALAIALVALLMGAAVLPAVAGPAAPDVGSASASPSTSPIPPTPQAYPVFNYPQVGLPDSSISDELVRLLEQVPPGAQVVASFYVMMPNHQVADALIAAHGRGAAVRVVLDSGNGQSASINQAMDDTFDRLGAALGKDVSASSFAMQCVLACISKADGSIDHNKFVAMSTSGDLIDVVFQSTANIRSDGSGDAAFNAAVVSSGNAELYASYQGYFDDLAARRSVPDNDYNAFRPPVAYGMSTPYYFPRTDDVDSVSRTLMSVDCAAAPTTVNVMASFFTRPKVRNRLNEMAQAGCGVRVIARTDTITREFCDSLLPPVQVRIADKSSASKVGIHGKYLTISGGFEGAVDRHVVWMGSHNLTRNALVRNDETFVLTDDRALHDAFAANFEIIWTDPSLTPGCDRALGTSETAIEEEANTEVTPLIKADPEVAPPVTENPATTPLIKAKQTVKRRLPKKLTHRRTRLLSTRTVEGRRLVTAAKCKKPGSSQKLKKRKACTIKRAKSNPTLVLDTKNRLKVRLIQSADGSATLLPFTRERDYTYRPPRKAQK